MPLGANRAALMGAAGTSVAVGGAYWSGDATTNTIDKTSFVDDASSVLSTTFSAARAYMSGASNGAVAAYFAGGTAVLGGGNGYDVIWKLPFATESIASITPTLSSTASEGSGCANSGTAAYWQLGRTLPDGSINSDTIDKTAFTDDATAAITPTLSVSIRRGGAYANSGTAAYWCHDTTVIDKTLFSDDSTSALSATLSNDVNYRGGLANSGTAGYTAFGYVMTDVINKLAFATDANAAITPTLSSGRWGGGAAAKSGTAGYWAGGGTTGASSSASNPIDKTAFTDDATAAITPVLAVGKAEFCGSADSGTL
ncbi:MAG: hypothetical protein VB860_01715 [Dehalococcoidia bacterium]